MLDNIMTFWVVFWQFNYCIFYYVIAQCRYTWLILWLMTMTYENGNEPNLQVKCNLMCFVLFIGSIWYHTYINGMILTTRRWSVVAVGNYYCNFWQLLFCWQFLGWLWRMRVGCIVDYTLLLQLHLRFFRLLLYGNWTYDCNSPVA